MLTTLALTLWLAATPEPPSVTIAAMGDVLVARAVPQRLAAHGAAWFWEPIKEELSAADLRFCNLECPVTTVGQPVPKPFCFRAAPDDARAVLSAGGLDLVSLANNHTWDYRRPGLQATLDHVASFGLLGLGAGRGRSGAVAARRVVRHGLRIAFLAYTCWTPEMYQPSDRDAAIATLDEGLLAGELKAAKVGADALVVSVHWGAEYSDGITDDQRRVGHELVDAGADLVLGAHPHVAEPIETYHGRPIVYSLGNAVFDRQGRRVSNGLLVRARVSAGAATVEKVTPLDILDTRPVPAPAAEPD
jgi:poly-gamma-glutamate synthesis protein (capsule biosynthesis protein)